MPMSTDIKISKTQTFKLIQSGRFLGSLLSKLAGPLMKVAVTLAKNILAPLEITAVASSIDTEIQKKIHGSGTKNLITPNKKKRTTWRTLFKSLKILIFFTKELLKNSKIKQKTKRRIFRNVIRHFRS